jgi:hypothetical protein
MFMRIQWVLTLFICLVLGACGGDGDNGNSLTGGSNTVDGDDATGQGGSDVADTTGTTDDSGDGADEGTLDGEDECLTADDCVALHGVSDPCSPYGCEEGVCETSALEDGVECDDSDACTSNTTCNNGVCEGESLNCDDKNECTSDSCNPANGCVNETLKDGASCDDGSECTVKDKCNDGECKGGKNICTEDCANEKDDNENGLVDCADPECAGAEECPMQCESIASIGCGDTVTVEIGGDGSTSNVGMWACSQQQWYGPESAWSFQWANPAEVTVTAKDAPDGIQLMRADDPAGIGCLPAFCTEASPDQLSFVAEPSSSYWLIVESNGNAGGSFELEVVCVECSANCAGKVCGGDGCGGSCGSCTGGKNCVAGACVSKPENENCTSATQLDVGFGFPIIVSGSTAGASDAYDLAASSGCDGSANAGFGLGAGDVVYTFTPTVTQDYLIAVNGDFDAAVVVVTDCNDLKGSCVGAGNTPNSGVEKVKQKLDKGYTYYIIVDGFAAGMVGAFDLTIAPWPCTPDCAGKECGPDGCGDTCGQCDGQTCTSNGKCTAAAKNSTCNTAYNVSSVPFFINHDTGAAGDDFEVFPEVCPGGPLLGKAGSEAPDLVYKFTAPGNGKYRVEVDPNTGFNALLSVNSACPPTFSDCIGGSDKVGIENVEFVLSGGESAWIVVDGTSPGDSGQFALSIKKVACTPQCTGKVCGDDGCGSICGGCKADEKCTLQQTCVPTPLNDQCIGAQPITQLPYEYQGDNEGAYDDYQVGAGECPGGPSAAVYGKGPDVVFVYTSDADHSVLFTFDQNFTLLNTFLYAVSDCDNISESCVQAQYSPLSGAESLVVPMKTGETIFVIVDGFAASSTGNFWFKADVFE